MDKLFRYRLELLPNDEVKELYSNIQINSENAGIDLFIAKPYNNINTTDLQPTMIGFGVRARMVEITIATGEERDVHYYMFPRSSIFKKKVHMANSVAVVDKGYRGEIVCPVWAVHNTSLEFGDRICQLVGPTMESVYEVRIVDSLPLSSRGEKGFGSSGA